MLRYTKQNINVPFARRWSSSLVLVILLIIQLEKVRIVRNFLWKWKRRTNFICQRLHVCSHSESNISFPPGKKIWIISVVKSSEMNENDETKL
jgi:hypothetical protein